MKSRAQIIKEKMQSGYFAKGFAVTTADPVFSEMAGYAGYDYVFIDAEHTPLDRREICNHISAAQSGGACAFVRVSGIDANWIKGILDHGPDGIIFPFIHNRDLAEKAVASCTYPDTEYNGVRGQGPRRAVQYGFGDVDAYLADAASYCLRFMQIESYEGCCHLREILSVPGVDGIYFGPGDLSRSLRAQDAPTPSIEDLTASVYHEVQKAGKLLGVPLRPDPDSIAKARRAGAIWGTCGIDTDIMAETMKQYLKMF